jgi:hypothetical protein
VSEAAQLDFFTPDCQDGPYTVEEFGLCDPPDQTCAFVDTTNQDQWIATVKNPKQCNINFTAIDGCVIKDQEYQGIPRCDAMLYTDYSLHLVELKARKNSEWLSDGKKQIISTIELLKTNNRTQTFKARFAHICNQRKPRYRSDESYRDFHLKHGFRLNTTATIDVNK